MECLHVCLIKVENMNPTTYQCQNCGNLYDVMLGDVATVEVSMGTSPPPDQDKPTT